MSKTNRDRREANRAALQQAQQQQQPKLENILGLDPSRFQPLADQVLLSIELEKEKSTESGLIVLARAEAQQLGGLPLGRVIAVGPDVKRVAVGDTVLAPPRDAAKIDVLLWLVPDAKILTKCKPAAPSLIERVEPVIQ